MDDFFGFVVAKRLTGLSYGFSNRIEDRSNIFFDLSAARHFRIIPKLKRFGWPNFAHDVTVDNDRQKFNYRLTNEDSIIGLKFPPNWFDRTKTEN